MRLLALILVLLMIVAAVPASAAENEYGVVNAWFNGKNATVEDIKMKVGEPAEVKVTVISKVDGHVGIRLLEIADSKDFDVLSGPSKQYERIANNNIEAGWSKTYIWTVAPNENWTNGNSPLNIFVSFYNLKKKNSKNIEFTIANPYILDEKYEGAIPTPEKTTPSTETASNQVQSDAKPFPYLYLVLIGAVIAVIVLFKLKK